MSMTDPIADMLTRIRNAHRISRDKVDVPASRIKEAIAKVLKDEGMIADYRRVEAKPQDIIRIYLKYSQRGVSVINEIRRESKPGCRVFRKVEQIRPTLNGFGIGIYSTSRGILSDRVCRELGVGGEHLCTVW